MAKKHKARPRTTDLLPDEEDFDYTRDKMQPNREPEAPVSIKAPKQVLDYAAKSKYPEGTMVTISSSLTHGTVVSAVGKDLLVLDSNGIIHKVSDQDVYRAQP